MSSDIEHERSIRVSVDGHEEAKMDVDTTQHAHDARLHGRDVDALLAPPSPSLSSSPHPSPQRSPSMAGHGSASPLPSPSAASSAARAHVHSDGVTVTVPSSSARSLIRAAHSCWSQSQQWHLLLYCAFFVYLVIVPMALALAFYLDLVQLLISVVFAIGLPFAIYHMLWRAESQRQRQEQERRQAHLAARQARGAASGASVVAAPSAHPASEEHSGLMGGFELVSKHYVYEMYQLLLTLLSCATYLFYTYKLRFSYTPEERDSEGAVLQEARGDYFLPLSDRVSFVQVEYFLIVSLSLDYLLRLVSARHKLAYALSFYSLIDLLCFTGVAYFSFWHAQLAPTNTIYNYYLFQAPCRFLRMRRALKSLDAPIRRRNGAGLALYRLGPLSLTKRSAFFVLLVLRIVLFLFTAAALVLAFEFPCIARAAEPAACSAELQRFHLCVYFVIVSLSTVGYGDITCHTDAGRMLMAVIIVFAVIQVPREIQAFSDLDAEQKEQAAKQAAHEARLVEHARALTNASAPPEMRRTSSVDLSSANVAGAAGVGAAAAAAAPSAAPSAAMTAFVSDDRALLCRWAQMQLAQTAATQPALLEQLTRALALPALDSPQAQCGQVVRALFGSVGDCSPQSPSSSPPAASFGASPRSNSNVHARHPHRSSDSIPSPRAASASWHS